MSEHPTLAHDIAPDPAETLAAPDGFVDAETPEPEPPDPAETTELPPLRVFPELAVSGATAAVLLMCVYSVLCIFWPAALGGRANPAATPVGAKPAWYFLFLDAFLQLVPPVVGTVAVFGTLVLFVAWPFIDRRPTRRPRERLVTLALGVLVLLVTAILTYAGWVSSR